MVKKSSAEAIRSRGAEAAGQPELRRWPEGHQATAAAGGELGCSRRGLGAGRPAGATQAVAKRSWGQRGRPEQRHRWLEGQQPEARSGGGSSVGEGQGIGRSKRLEGR